MPSIPMELKFAAEGTQVLFSRPDLEPPFAELCSPPSHLWRFTVGKASSKQDKCDSHPVSKCDVLRSLSFAQQRWLTTGLC